MQTDRGRNPGTDLPLASLDAGIMEILSINRLLA